MSIVRTTTLTLSAALAFGAALVTGGSAYAEERQGSNQAAAPSAQTSQRIAAGRTEAGQGWQPYENVHGIGIYLDVDTSSAHFTGTPVYTSSIGGDSNHWLLTGSSAIYMPTATGFRVYLRRSDGTAVTPEHAQQFGWYIDWIGIDNP